MFSKRRFLNMTLILLAQVLALQVGAVESQEYQGRPEWSDFSQHIALAERRQGYEGIAYGVSGALVVIGSSVGLHNSDDVLAKGVYSISQGLGVAAIGYGVSLSLMGDQERSFYQVIDQTPQLSLEQKSAILRSYLEKRSEVRRQQKWIRIATHALIASLQFYHASREEDPELRTALYFFGGINAIAVFSF